MKQFLSGALVFALAAALGTASPAATLQGKSLLSALRHGGYVIVFRHAATDQTKPDHAVVDLKDCRTQRILTDDGRIMARNIGNAFDQDYIQVDKVLSSPLCRTTYTAELAFGHVDSVVPGLREPKPKNAANAAKAAAVLRPLLAEIPAPGMNDVIVTHGFNIQAITHFKPAEGEAVIFKPAPGGTFVIVARVKASEWQGLNK
ncbi:MAG TPA: histidine phosphatase family protein [Candidatus Rubrimentiphilum sp.]|nr:histidine phosphatase family protein [Candidatus Rubrimentiphilum sp.]